MEEVVVTEITPEGTFYAQNCQQGPDAVRLNTNLRQEFDTNPPIPGAYKPKKGDICAAKFTLDNEWYRAKVEKIQGNNASVLYIDYGNREVSLFKCIVKILVTEILFLKDFECVTTCEFAGRLQF